MRKVSLENGKIGSLFIRLVIPAVISQLITLAYNMVDRIYIGHMPEAGSVALIFLTRGFSRQILFLFGASPDTLPYALSYFHIYVCGTVFVEIAAGLAFFITAQGYTTVSMVSVLLGAGLNILLDPVLIFGLHMGVAGAAVATVLSQAVSCAWVLWFLCGKRGMIRLKRKYLRLDWGLLLPALSLGLSPFVQVLTESLISVCFNRSLLQYGGDAAVGAMTIFATVMQFVSLPITGIAQGAQISCQLMFVALGNAQVSLFLALLRKVFLLVPLIFLLPHFMPDPVKAVFLAEPVADTAACATTVTLFMRQYRRKFSVKKGESGGL